MNNPFIKISKKGTKYISQVSSVNKLVMYKVPIIGIEDSIEGKTFEQIFSLKSILEEIEKNKKSLNIENENIVPSDINKVLLLSQGEDEKLRIVAEKIIKKFGYRLGLIFLALRVGDEKNRKYNVSFNNDMWNYFNTLEDVLLVGGLASGDMGEKLLQYALEIFNKAEVTPYKFIIFENASMVGVMGCVSKIEEDSTSLVLDMGHTNIKMLWVTKKKGEFYGLKELSTEKSKYVDKPKGKAQINIEEAKKLHNYLVNIIISAYNKGIAHEKLSDTIIISIANYVVDGKLDAQRGGYSKLSILGENYAEIISEEISGRLKKKVKVKLIHDATAVAMYFNGYNNAACITMGTAFGISFTDINNK